MNGHRAAAALPSIEAGAPSLSDATAVLPAGALSRTEGRQRPRPTVLTEIGGRPLLWHLMMQFAAAGLHRFVVLTGEHGDQVKRYLLDLASLSGDLSLDLGRDEAPWSRGGSLDWSIDVLDLAADGDASRLRGTVGQRPALLVAGDSLANVDLAGLYAFHRRQGRLATLVAVRPPARFGALALEGDEVVEFAEKPALSEDWRSAGLCLVEAEAFELIGDVTDWETGGIERLARAGEVAAYQHGGYWQSLETLRDRQQAEELWQAGRAPWKTWR